MKIKEKRSIHKEEGKVRFTIKVGMVKFGVSTNMTKRVTKSILKTLTAMLEKPDTMKMDTLSIQEMMTRNFFMNTMRKEIK